MSASSSTRSPTGRRREGRADRPGHHHHGLARRPGRGPGGRIPPKMGERDRERPAQDHTARSGKVLRSGSPELIEQEIWGYLLTSYAICALICEAATAAGIDPDRVKFRRTSASSAGLSARPFPPHQADALLSQVKADITRKKNLSPRRRHAPTLAQSSAGATTPTASRNQQTMASATMRRQHQASQSGKTTGSSMIAKKGLMDRKQNVLIYRDIIRRYTGRQRSAATRLVDLRPGCFAWYGVDQMRKNGTIVRQYPRSESNRHWGPF